MRVPSPALQAAGTEVHPRGGGGEVDLLEEACLVLLAHPVWKVVHAAATRVVRGNRGGHGGTESTVAVVGVVGVNTRITHGRDDVGRAAIEVMLRAGGRAAAGGERESWEARGPASLRVRSHCRLLLFRGSGDTGGTGGRACRRVDGRRGLRGGLRFRLCAAAATSPLGARFGPLLLEERHEVHRRAGEETRAPARL